MIKGTYSFKALVVLLVTSFLFLFGVLWIGSLFNKTYHKLANQMILIWTCYDSAAMIFNVLMFCLACTKFLA